jgi:serpin B
MQRTLWTCVGLVAGFCLGVVVLSLPTITWSTKTDVDTTIRKLDVDETTFQDGATPQDGLRAAENSANDAEQQEFHRQWTLKRNPPRSRNPKIDITSVVKSNNDFSIALYQQCAQANDQKNFVCSPFSLFSAMGMLYAGADGKTREGIAKACRFSQDEAFLHPALSEMLLRVRYPGDRFTGSVNVANAVWVDRSVNVLKPFESLVNAHYDAGVYRLDLVDQPQRASKIINQWANKHTFGMIKEPISADFFAKHRHTIALTNCFYFEDKWLYPFKPANTKTEKFWVTAKDSVDVQMMHGESTCGYAKVDGMEILEIEYAGREHSLMVVSPPGDTTLVNMRGKLSELQQWRKQCMKHKVKLAMPKLDLTSDLALRGFMYNMGFQQCDLSRIGNVGEISNVLQKVKLQIDEEGTKAAAFTVLAAYASSGASHSRSASIGHIGCSCWIAKRVQYC